jgi:hypothetical protein
MFYPLEDNADVEPHIFDEIKNAWDLILIIILLFLSLLSPYRMAFVEEEEAVWTVVQNIADIMFAVDIFVSFNTAFYDEGYLIVDNRKEIALEYLRSWFIIDMLAVIPFEFLFKKLTNFGEYNGIFKLLRISRMYKFVKLSRLIKILKIIRR